MQVGFQVGDAAPLEGRSRTSRLHELIGVPGHTLLLVLGPAKRGAINKGSRWQARPRGATDRIGKPTP
jgi:hypothetical protein